MDLLSTETKEEFRHSPALVQEAIDERINDCDWDYGVLSAGPRGLLQTDFGSERSESTPFVAICRTLGILARPDSVFGRLQFYTSSVWANLHRGQSENNTSAVLLLESAGGKPLHYGEHFIVVRLCGGAYQTLQCDTNWIGKALRMELPPGKYRILTANWQVDGSVLLRAETVRLSADETAEKTVYLRGSQIASRLRHMPVGEYLLMTPGGRCALLSAPTMQTPAAILAILQLGIEPTEHLLNEIIEPRDSHRDKNTILVASPPGVDNPMLRYILKTILLIQLSTCDEQEFKERLCVDLQFGDRGLPLATVLEKSMHARFVLSNHNVGITRLLLQIADY